MSIYSAVISIPFNLQRNCTTSFKAKQTRKVAPLHFALGSIGVSVSAISVVDACCQGCQPSARTFPPLLPSKQPPHCYCSPHSFTHSFTHTMQIDEVRAKFGRFRILIIGRANAGKTTILKKICNSMEDPEIYDDKGDKVWLYFVSLVLISAEVAIRSIAHGFRNLQG